MTLLSIMRGRSLQALITSTLIIQLLNFSIDPADHSFSDDLSVNEIESFMELWVEIVLGNGDVLQETEESDEQKGKRDTPSNFLFNSALTEFLHSSEPHHVQHNTSSMVDFKSPETPITTPPPRSLAL